MFAVLDLGSASQVHRQWQETFTDPESFALEQVRSYWESLFLNLNLPRGDNINLSIAVPCCYDCLTRSLIMDILTQNYGYKKIKLIPRSLALIGGYLTLHPQCALFTDLLTIWPEEDNLDFSFISIAESCFSLELQSIGSWAKLQEEAGRLKLLNPQGKLISQILYANPSPSANLNGPVSELGNYAEILTVEDLSQTILLGLNYWSMADAAKGDKVFRMIYPYDYYLERSTPAQKNPVREKLSFDTSNLELDSAGSYKIASLATTSLYIDPEDSYVDLAVYEAGRDSWLLNPFIGAPALQLRLSKAKQLDCLELWLDMEAASISLPSNGSKANRSESLLDDLRFHSNESQHVLTRLLAGSAAKQSLRPDLIPDLLTNPRQESANDLEDYLKMIQFKLYELLELWSRMD